MKNPFNISRRSFVKAVAGSAAGIALAPLVSRNMKFMAADDPKPKPSTNIADAMKYPRNENSMPGKYPGKVVQITHDKSVVDKKIDYAAANEMVRTGITRLTGIPEAEEAWLKFVKPGDVIALKVNPVAGPTLSTSHEVVRSVIEQLEKAGISRKNLVIWDRREFELHEVGFTEENYPGIRITGPECKDTKGSYYDESGKLYGEQRIDKDWYYWADAEEKYDAETIPYMINEGKYSFFSKVLTKEIDKIINIPILKNAGPTVTLCLKNLAFGSITNTSRLHKQLWVETCAEVCAFPPLRDKLVLNIADGLKGCFNGGPGANPQFFTEYKTILMGTDPVAVDRIGYEIVLKKRIEEGLQKAESPTGRKVMDLAEKLQLGIADLNKISLDKIELGKA